MAPRLSTESRGRVPIFGIVTSPASTTAFDFTSVSQATRLVRSIVRQASRTLSEMKSATLSGWPSPTDSEEKTNVLAMVREMRERPKQGAGIASSEISTYRDSLIRYVDCLPEACPGHRPT